MNDPAITPRSRRLRSAPWLLPVVLLGGWFGGKAIVRAWVDAVIVDTEGRALPAFALPDQQGTVWTPEALRGKPAVLHFFRSRCPSCDVEAPELRAVEQALRPDQATILHVMTDRVLGFPEAETAATLAGKGFRRPVLLADAAFVDAFHTVQWSHVTPVTYVVDASGRIRQALRGKQTCDGLLAAVAAVR